MLVYGFVLAAVITDIKFQRISNRLILFGLVVGLIRRILLEGSHGLFMGVIQISLPVLFLYLFYLFGALGAGDVKLFSLIGVFVNLKELTVCVIGALVIGAIWSFFYLILQGRGKIPFSPAILGGLLLATLK